MPLFLFSTLLAVLVEAAISLASGRGLALPGLSLLLLNGLIAFSLVSTLIVSGLFSVRAALMASAAFVVALAYVNACKLQFLGLPLLPWDVSSTGQTLNLLPFLKAELVWPTLLFGLVLLLALGLASRLGKGRRRGALGPHLLAMLATGLILVNPGFVAKGLEALGVEDMIWVPVESYAKNGFMLGFAINVRRSFIIPPPGYGEEAARKLDSAYGAAALKTGERKPNVIVVMNEAFWDPTVLQGVRFDRDPAPNLRALQARFPHGQLISPAFGGGTSNVEFEALTGFSTAFLPPASNAYQQFIKQPLPSLAHVAKGLGYTATAIHSYHDWFWNRRSVYKHLGFDAFVSKTEMAAPKLKGIYIEDADVTQEIVAKTAETDGPDFVYAVTMQNHGPYSDDRYGKQNELAVTAAGAKDPQDRLAIEQILRTYGQGILDADRALAGLVAHYRRSPEPTIIVFFGDHLPMLGANYLTYDKLGYLETTKSADWSPETYARMHTTPLLVWNNFGSSALPRALGRVDASFLPALVLRQMGVEPAGYYRFLSAAHDKLGTRHADLETLAKAEDPVVQALLRDYEVVQHDQMFGARYLKKGWFGQ